MQHILEPYQDYLKANCRFHAETVAHCIDTVPRIFRSLDVARVEQIDANRVSRALMQSRWEITPEGIQRVESNQDGYLVALKQFLQYLEDSGYSVPEGLSSLVQVEATPAVKLGGLTKDEENQLRQFLVFNVKNDTQRRDTALLFLLMSVDISLEEALSLRVHKDGIIQTDMSSARSGDFQRLNKKNYLKVKSAKGVYRKVSVPLETVNFLNFYLENRKHKSNRLFIKNSGKNALDAISLASAKRFVNKAFKEASLEIKPAQILEILRSTAVEKQVAPKAILQLSHTSVAA